MSFRCLWIINICHSSQAARLFFIFYLGEERGRHYILKLPVVLPHYDNPVWDCATYHVTTAGSWAAVDSGSQTWARTPLPAPAVLTLMTGSRRPLGSSASPSALPGSPWPSAHVRWARTGRSVPECSSCGVAGTSCGAALQSVGCVQKRQGSWSVSWAAACRFLLVTCQHLIVRIECLPVGVS